MASDMDSVERRAEFIGGHHDLAEQDGSEIGRLCYLGGGDEVGSSVQR